MKYGHNLRRQVTAMTYPNAKTVTNVDEADELTTDAATTQAYDLAGQLTTTLTGATSAAYVFDARGNRTKATTGTTVTSYGYHQANGPTSYTRGTTTATYAYNGVGLRAAKTTGAKTMKFIYDTAQGMRLILNDSNSSYLATTPSPAPTPPGCGLARLGSPSASYSVPWRLWPLGSEQPPRWGFSLRDRRPSVPDTVFARRGATVDSEPFVARASRRTA